MAGVPIILDVDPGHDDAVAMMMACGAAGLGVRAVTTVAGNAELEKTTRNALKVLALIGREDIPVGAGAAAPLARPLVTGKRVHGESGLGGPDLPEPDVGPDERGAVGLMAAVVEGSSVPVTLVPVGPLTNVATFFSEHPRLKKKVDRIVLMGGSVGSGNVTPAAEFNIYVDPEAAQVVFESGVPITMAGLDVTREAYFGPSEVERLRDRERFGRVGAFAAALVEFFAKTYEGIYGSNAPPIHDAVAVAAVLDPAVLKTRRMRVDVEREGEFTLGETVCDVAGVTGKEPNADVGVGLDRERFLEILFKSLGGLAG